MNYKNIAGRVINTLVFYFGWILLAYQAAQGDIFWGILLIAVVTIIHLFFVKNLLAEIIIIISLAILGTAIDTIFSMAKVINYRTGYSSFPMLAPPWLTAMWVLFAITINHAFEWLHSRPLLAMLFGACGGPFTYLAAMKLGDAEFLISPTVGIAILAVLWAFLFPAIIQYSLWVQRITAAR